MNKPVHYRAQIVDWSAAQSEAEALRREVFVVEQGVDAALERDGRDPACSHVLVRNAAAQAVATGRLLPDGHIGRMAVLASERGCGAGSAALGALIEHAMAQGVTELRLNAQVSAQGFYLRHGFVFCGPEFIEAGIRHRPMRHGKPSAADPAD